MSQSLMIADDEAQILSQYLIGQACSDDTIRHYSAAVHKRDAALDDAQMKTWRTMLRFPFYMKLIDSGLAIVTSQSPLRKRIFIMLTLLESTPEHTLYFLPQERSIWYLIPLGFRAALSGAYMISGAIAVRLLRVG